MGGNLVKGVVGGDLLGWGVIFGDVGVILEIFDVKDVKMQRVFKNTYISLSDFLLFLRY